MVETMKIRATPFKRSHARAATLSAPNSAVGHLRPTPLPQTPAHSRQVWVSLLWGHCSFLLGSGRRLSNTALSQSLWGLWVLVCTRRMHWSQQTPSSNNTGEDSTHGHYHMVSTEIRLIIFFAVKDGEALYSQQKQDWELTVAQIMKPLLQNSDLN